MTRRIWLTRSAWALVASFFIFGVPAHAASNSAADSTTPQPAAKPKPAKSERAAKKETRAKPDKPAVAKSAARGGRAAAKLEPKASKPAHADAKATKTAKSPAVAKSKAAATASTKEPAPAKKAAVSATAARTVPLPRPQPARGPAREAGGRQVAVRSAVPPLPLMPATYAAAPIAAARPFVPLAVAPTATTSPADLAAVKQAIGLIRKGNTDEASGVERTISDPLARKLVEWLILRSDDNDVDFARYDAFIVANPGWPSIVTLRRRAEALLWQERAPPATVRAFFATTKPMTAKGCFALARALLTEGDRAGAQRYAGEAWRTDAFSRDLESAALDQFSGLITRADDKARMDRRLYVGDNEAALRAAERLGGVEPDIARARAAVNANSSTAKALLDAIPPEARHDAGYIFSRAQWLRRNDRIEEAGRLMLTAPRDPARLQNLDEWWIERRLISRKLLDLGDARTAYLIARDAVPPTKVNYRAEHEFTAGWIALRFLHDPASAAYHFARVAQGSSNPITLARASYWQGRAAEAAHRPQEARAHYQAAARYPTAYYGQLARARLGLRDIALAPAPLPPVAHRLALSRLEVVRAAEILYAVDERDYLVPIMADLADKTGDVGALATLAELAGRHRDAYSMLLVGKTALGRGFAFGHYAFPAMGLPRYSRIGPEVEPAIVYAIARQESAFNPKTVSSANALGLMQVTPDAGRYVAKKFRVAFDRSRLLHDPVYNVQMGSAELGDVIERFRGSYILAFAAYNAGAGRVRQWIERYGDPRDPGVDPVDWVERIPFSETRNYVERVMENLQVYRARFGGGSRLMIEADLRRGAEN